MSELSAPAAILWRARLLDYLDGHAADMVADLADLVRVPSISGSAEENAIQDVLSARLAGDGCDVDAWPIPMAETLGRGLPRRGGGTRGGMGHGRSAPRHRRRRLADAQRARRCRAAR